MFLLYKLKEQAVLFLLYLLVVWVVLALSFQVFMISNQNAARDISNQLTLMFDGRYKDMQGSVWYQEPKNIAIGAIENKIQIGNLAGNRKLEFGVKNVLEEIYQDKGYDIDHASNNVLKVNIVYLDVLKTQSSLSIIHSNKESVVIRLQGFLYKGDKLVKKILVEESADEISMSTLLIDEGGKFNNQNLSTALKKACNSLVNKLY